MIQVVCTGCGSKLKAKRALIGQTRQCPKCSEPVLIALPQAEADVVDNDSENDAEAGDDLTNGTAPAAAEQPMAEAASAGEVAALGPLPSHHFLDRLNRHHYYFICDRTEILAAWENNGKGWQVHTPAGMGSAARNQQALHAQGDYRLVEIKAHVDEHGTRLTGLSVYRLASRWALPALARGDDAIVEKIADRAGLNRDQKSAIRAALKERFMHEIWQHARTIADYLANTDFHSHEA